MSYNIVKINSLSELGNEIQAGSGNVRFQCPHCIETGDKYEDYKLYIKKFNNIGFCFRCESVFVLSDKVPELGVVARLFSEYLEHINSEEHVIKPKTFSMELVEDLNDAPLVKKYLLNRGVSPEVIKHWDIKAMDIIGSKYVYVYDKKLKDGFTNFYQLRTIENRLPKYMSAKTQIPIMKLDKFFYDRLFLVEGVFDAFAVGIEALPLMGKALSNAQLGMLYSHFSIHRFPKDVYIMLDGGTVDESQKIFKKLMKILVMKSRIHYVQLPYGKDPEDVKEQIPELIAKAHRIF